MPTPSRSSLPLLLLLLILGVCLFFVFRLWRDSTDYLARSSKTTETEEARSQAALAGRLASLARVDRAGMAEIALSTDVLKQLVEQFDGIKFQAVDGIQVQLDELCAEFRDGFPHVQTRGKAIDSQGRTISVAASIVLQTELQPTAVSLHLHCLDLVPADEYLPDCYRKSGGAMATPSCSIEFCLPWIFPGHSNPPR